MSDRIRPLADAGHEGVSDAMRGQIGSTFRIDGGDGDQKFFGVPMIARRVSEPWFGNMLPRGEAYLLCLISGPYVEDYIAITSRLVESLSDQLARSNWLSVIVHRIISPGASFRSTLEAAPAVGMAVIEAQ